MKLHRKKELLENDQIILKSIDKLIRSSRLNEETALRDTSQGWFKESLAVYFATMVTDDEISQVEKKLSFNEGEQLKIKIKLPEVTDFKRYGSNAAKTIVDSIKHLVEDVVLREEKKFYYNAISIAKLLRKIYGGKIDPEKIDMGDDYNEIRKKGVSIASTMSKELGNITADKWCPADIFIYNDFSDIEKAKNAKFLNIDVGDEIGLNGLFQSNPESEKSKGIFAISLKEQKSQGGAGSSFKNILTKPENFPDVDKIENIDALSIIYHLDNFILKYPNPKSTHSYHFANLSFAHASAKKLLERRSDSTEISKSAKKAIKLIENIFESTLGDKTPPKTKPRKDDPTSGGKYDFKKIESAFKQANVSEFKVPEGTKELVKSISKNISEAAINEYQKLRKEFLKDLKTAGYNPPTTSPKLDEMKNDVKRTLAKSGCYKTASYVLKNMSSGAMTIPKEFSTIAEQKNIFVAMTAYAVGLSGISPTFFKIRGVDKPNGVAHMEPFYGNGFFHLDDDSQIEIEDNSGNAGFMISFISKVTRNKDKNSETVSKYETKMEYRSAGEQITVQVRQLDPFEYA